MARLGCRAAFGGRELRRRTQIGVRAWKVGSWVACHACHVNGPGLDLVYVIRYKCDDDGRQQSNRKTVPIANNTMQDAVHTYTPHPGHKTFLLRVASKHV